MKTRSLAIAFLISFLVGAGLTYAMIEIPQIKVNPELEEEALSSTVAVNKQTTTEMLALTSYYEGIGKSLRNYLQMIFEYGLIGGLNYTKYHDPQAAFAGNSAPSDLAYNQEYNETIATSVSSFKVAPSAFPESYQTQYLAGSPETTSPFSLIPKFVGLDINKTSRLLDLMKINLDPEINFIEYGAENGYSITFPFKQFDRSYDPRSQQWYVSGVTGNKDVVFVIDRSGSLTPSALEALRNATKEAIETLSPQDRFTVITFADSQSYFSRNLVVATDTAKEEAFAFIDRLQPGGLSDIGNGLGAGLKLLANLGFARNQKILIGLTDGKPTSGITNNETLAETLAKENGLAKADMILYGISNSTDEKMLNLIANQTGGLYERTNTSDLMRMKIPQYYSLVSNRTTTFEVWNRPRINTRADELISNLVFKINIDGKHHGILRLEVDLNKMLLHLFENQVFKGQQNFIITRDGQTFLHTEFLLLKLDTAKDTDIQKPIEEFTVISEEFKAGVNRITKGIFSSGLIVTETGDKYFMAFSQLGETGLVVGTLIPYSTFIPNELLEKLEAVTISYESFYLTYGVAFGTSVIILLFRKRLIKEEPVNE